MTVFIYPTEPDFEALRGRECEVLHECETAYLVRVGRATELVLPKNETRTRRWPECGTVPAVRRR